MKISIILANPDEKSFNHEIANTSIKTLNKNGYELYFHDLYKENFDPLLPKDEIPIDGNVPGNIMNYCNEISSSDGVIIIHPNWWGQPPAILKGWIDRVLRPGIAYKFVEGDKGDGIPVGLLKAKSAIIFNTSNTPDERELKVFQDPLKRIWFNCIFELCGVKKIYRKMYNCIITSTLKQREEWLSQVQSIINNYFPNLK